MPRTRPLRFKKNLAYDQETKRWYARKVVHGRPMQRSWRTKTAALQWLDHLELLAAGVPLPDSYPTLPAAWDAFLAHRRMLGVSPATIEYYEDRRKPLEGAAGHLQLNQITQREIDAYVQWRQSQKIGNGTILKDLKALASVYRHAEAEIKWRIPALRHSPKRRQVQPVEAVRALWGALPARAKPAMGLCLLAGIRAAEAYRATSDWVHGRELHVENRKNQDTNRTWIVDTLHEVLPAEGPLVAERPSKIEGLLRYYSHQVELERPYTGPGAFRHHCATYIIDLGYTTDDVRLILGHTHGGVTDRYLHSQQIARKREILEALERYVFGPPPSVVERKG